MTKPVSQSMRHVLIYMSTGRVLCWHDETPSVWFLDTKAGSDNPTGVPAIAANRLVREHYVENDEFLSDESGMPVFTITDKGRAEVANT